MEDIIFISTEDIDRLIEYISELQIVFHPNLFCDGTITAKQFIELERSSKNKILLLDSNFCTYLYDISKYGKCNCREFEILTGILVTFSRLINADLSFGFSVYENDYNENTVPSKIKEDYVLNLLNNTSTNFWLDIAKGNYDHINKPNLDFNKKVDRYITSDTHLLMHTISLMKIVILYKSINKRNPFDIFIEFLNWYIDNMIISTSIVAYAAMLFSSQEYIKAPKNCNSNIIDNVIKGIKNQAWDFNQITQWSTFYSKEDKENSIYMFATNDVMLKRIMIESIYSFCFPDVVYSIFNTKKQVKIINNIVSSKLGDHRIMPFDLNDRNESLSKMNNLYDQVFNELKQTILNKVP